MRWDDIVKQRQNHRITTRYPRPAVLLGTWRRTRLARFNDPATAEDDYYRFANRNH